MRQLNGMYTQIVNRVHGRGGHVFQGRYKPKKTAICCYVVLNPLQAGMVGDVGDWPWISYQAMIGHVPSPTWLRTDWLLGQFGQQQNHAIANYVDFLRADVGLPNIWDNLNGHIYLGSAEFIARMQSTMAFDQPLEEFPRAQRRPVAKTLQHYYTQFADNPGTGMALAYLSGDYAMKVIAQESGVHYTTFSRAVKSYEFRAEN